MKTFFYIFFLLSYIPSVSSAMQQNIEIHRPKKGLLTTLPFDNNTTIADIKHTLREKFEKIPPHRQLTLYRRIANPYAFGFVYAPNEDLSDDQNVALIVNHYGINQFLLRLTRKSGQ